MKRWLFLTLVLGLLSVPGGSFLISIIEVSNEVHISALVEDESADSEEEPSSVVEASGSGGGSGSGSSSNGTRAGEEEDDEDASDFNENDSDETMEESEAQEESTVINENEEEEAGQEEEPVDEIQEEVPPAPQADIFFAGYAFPSAQVRFTLDGTWFSTLVANEEGYFEGSYSNLDLGEHIFTFQAESYDGDQSRLVSYAYTVQNESPLYISSILLPPIFTPDGPGTNFGGVAIPGAEIQIFGVSQGGGSLVALDTISVKEDGTYDYQIDLKDGVFGQYYVSCTFKGEACGYSGIIPVQVIGDSYEIPSNVFADFTKDIKVNFVDFSFMRAAFLSEQSILFYDLDEDGELTLKDFSLLDYQWTQ